MIKELCILKNRDPVLGAQEYYYIVHNSTYEFIDYVKQYYIQYWEVPPSENIKNVLTYWNINQTVVISDIFCLPEKNM